MLSHAQSQGIPTIEGDAAAPGVLGAAGVDTARLLVVATPDSFLARRIVEVARELNPAIDVVVRTHLEPVDRLAFSLRRASESNVIRPGAPLTFIASNYDAVNPRRAQILGGIYDWRSARISACMRRESTRAQV